ncbi:MAG: hypothetical protein CMG64_06540 [Candidatus Marinimicrobia bacterium]|nr:hypothetical protein [Candidatus Neomarinimicrobiota bacterium]
MRYINIILFLVVAFSVAFPHNGKHKRWKHKKKHHIRKVHKKPRINVSLGYNYIWPKWRWNYNYCHRHHNRDVVVIQNENDADKNENIDELIAQIEKLAILKEKGIISEKDYEKKKKDLLKRI